MITKAQVKDIRALASVKGRAEQNRYLAEGDKLVREWLSADREIEYIIALHDWLKQYRSLTARHPEARIIAVSEEDLERVSTQKTPNAALIVAPIPEPPGELPVNEWCIVLDNIQDPGNLGSIIRIADWFGIDHVVCSPGCSDFYNPKVVAAGMGGHLRVQLHTASLPLFLSSCEMPILAATLSGQPLHETSRLKSAALVIGNESKGISAEVLARATKQLTIPRRGGAESLNAAVSAGIILSAIGPV